MNTLGSAVLPQRVRFLDAARGSAMLFVLLSHFGFTFFANQNAAAPRSMRLIGMVASPTFVLVNGILLGFLHRMHRHDFRRIRAKFVDRGIFLVTIGHLLILGSHAPAYTRSFWCLSDTIGVCMIVQPWLLERLRPAQRLRVGLAIYAVSWISVLLWSPQGQGLNLIKETLVGSLDPVVYRYEFPVLPWFGLALGATTLGDRIAHFHLAGNPAGMRRSIGWTSVIALAAAIMFRGSFALAHREFPQAMVFRRFLPLFNPFEKQPPSPEYLFAYGAVGLALLYTWLVVEQRSRAKTVTTMMASLGQVSLFVFLLQWYVYFLGFYPVRGRLPFAGAWPIYLLGSIGLIVVSANWWQRHNGNRLLTVGLPQPSRSSMLAVSSDTAATPSR